MELLGCLKQPQLPRVIETFRWRACKTGLPTTHCKISQGIETFSKVNCVLIPLITCSGTDIKCQRLCTVKIVCLFKIVLMLTLHHRFCISFTAAGIRILYLFINTLNKAKIQARITFKYRVTF